MVLVLSLLEEEEEVSPEEVWEEEEVRSWRVCRYKTLGRIALGVLKMLMRFEGG